jgi:hypothetical protein
MDPTLLLWQCDYDGLASEGRFYDRPSVCVRFPLLLRWICVNRPGSTAQHTLLDHRVDDLRSADQFLLREP